MIWPFLRFLLSFFYYLGNYLHKYRFKNKWCPWTLWHLCLRWIYLVVCGDLMHAVCDVFGIWLHHAFIMHPEIVFELHCDRISGKCKLEMSMNTPKWWLDLSHDHNSLISISYHSASGSFHITLFKQNPDWLLWSNVCFLSMCYLLIGFVVSQCTIVNYRPLDMILYCLLCFQ